MAVPKYFRVAKKTAKYPTASMRCQSRSDTVTLLHTIAGSHMLMCLYRQDMLPVHAFALRVMALFHCDYAAPDGGMAVALVDKSLEFFVRAT